MQITLPPLTPSNQRATEILTRLSEQHLDPLEQFRAYAKKFGGDLSDNLALEGAGYIDFEDYDYLHNTSPLKPVYLNDFDFNLEEDREALSRLTRMEFTENTFDTVAMCSCKKLKGNHLIGSGRVCVECGDEVSLFLDKGQDTKIWLRCPEGVAAFVNLGFYNTFFNNIQIRVPHGKSESSNPKITLVRYFIDPLYRQDCNRQARRSLLAIEALQHDLGIEEINLNTFFQRCDDIMEWVLVGAGTRYNKADKDGPTYYQFYLENRDIAFCQYLKVPNRFCNILERNGKEVYGYSYHPETAQLYYAIADTKKSNSCYTLTKADIGKNIDIVGKSLVKLVEQYRKVNNPKGLFDKPALNRKHVCSGPLPFTGRSVITSVTRIADINQLVIPWRMALTQLEFHILNHLYRLGYTPNKAKAKFNQAAYEVDADIDAFFRDMEENRKCVIQAGRNPSIEYLSLRGFYPSINRDLSDESIKIPILACGVMNA